ncbi:FimV/HubP family polar landmark protein [Salinisphaera sp. T31B1]|uniref:FimV/HubP family polar landmark protein n=1 Tax=Salinisphaera sp. T31B1 TaxID=727963 RepID=UPI00333E5FE6
MTIRRWLGAGALLALGLHAGLGFALGFGSLRVQSALNEPLEASFDLVSLSAEEQASLAVDVASSDMFERFGIERSSLADDLRIRTTHDSSGRVTVHLSTRRTVREPFLRFLIEARTSQGKALREYTALLDPPGRRPPPVGRSDPAPAVSERSAPRRSSTPPASAPSPSRTNTAAIDSDRYGPVRRGETLFSIAERIARPGTSQAQRQLALYRDNPQAFSGSMDMLLRGAMLKVPPAERIAAIDPDAARAAIRAARESPSADDSSGQAATTVARTSSARDAVEPPPPTTSTDATLRLEPPRTPAGSSPANNEPAFGRLVMPAFDDTAVAAAPAATTADDTAPVAASPDTVIAATTAAGDSSSQAESATPAPAVTSEQSMASDATGAGASQPLSAAGADVAAAGDNGLLRPVNLVLLGISLLLLVLLLLWRRRREYRPVPLDFDEPSDTPAEHATSGTTAGAASPNDPSLETPDALGSVAEPETGRRGIAPSVRLQDADRQMKLGQFGAALATLEEGLASHPEDAALQDKLLELDYLAGDAARFDRDVDRFGAALADNGVRWAGVAAMGRLLLPHDARFASQPVHPGTYRSEPVEPGEPVASVATPARPAPEPVGPANPAPVAPDSPAPMVGRDVSDEVDHRESSAPGDALDLPAAEPGAPVGTPVTAVSPDTAAPGTSPGTIDDRPAAAVADEHGLSLDLDDGYEWKPQPAPPGGERRHDLGDERGMPFELDTSDYSADLESVGRDDLTSSEPPTSVAPIDTSEFDLGDAESSNQTETDADSVDIRLDLARMYIDMEDAGSARELLEEALAEGSESQKATARQLLDTL